MAMSKEKKQPLPLPPYKFSLIQRLFNWGQANSLWVFPRLGCGCGQEYLALLGPSYDMESIGIRDIADPTQADLLVVAGPITPQLAESLQAYYEALKHPRYVMALGNCAVSGGIFGGTPLVRSGLDSILPVDLFVPGCPPRPEQILAGFQEMKRMIQSTRYGDFRSRR
jgi:NADH-quinone oxidoreductase subunit B